MYKLKLHSLINTKSIKNDVFSMVILLLFAFSFKSSLALSQQESYLRGQIVLDTSWERIIYLSLVPTFDHMNSMSQDMIVAKSTLDTFGNYSFDIKFLPKEDKLFRLHLVKKGGSANSLIIGGNDENHLFLILNGTSNVGLNSAPSIPPFKSSTL